MASSGYTAITFVADQLLTSTVMNQMGANDAAFNNGNGFNDGIIATRHFAAGAINNAAVGAAALYATKFHNPYKFSAYRSTAFTGSAATALPLNVESFDTGNNYNTSTGIFTVPVNGFYFFDTQMTLASGSTAYFWATIYKNGVEFRRGNRSSYTPASGMAVWSMVLAQLTAGDTIAFGFAASASITLETGANIHCIGEGYLVSAT